MRVGLGGGSEEAAGRPWVFDSHVRLRDIVAPQRQRALDGVRAHKGTTSQSQSQVGAVDAPLPNEGILLLLQARVRRQLHQLAHFIGQGEVPAALLSTTRVSSVSGPLILGTLNLDEFVNLLEHRGDFVLEQPRIVSALQWHA